MITVRMELLGAKELEALFGELAQHVRAEFISPAIQPAAQLVLETAQRLVPRRADERLLRSLFAEESLADEAGAEWVVGCEKHLGWYAVFEEFGTAPHEQGKGAHVHPGAAPHPFLRPAVDLNHDEIFRLIGEGIGKDLEAVAAGAAT